MKDSTEILATHYQNKYELTHELWTQRNSSFLFLLAAIGIGAVLIFGTQDTNSLIIYGIASLLGISDAARIDAMQRSFPFALLQTIVLIVVYYLMVNLYHRTVSVFRLYRYMGELEREIRQGLELPVTSFAFTRESTFYWHKRPRAIGFIKWVYTVLLGVLLFMFLGGRIYGDIHAQQWLLVALDVVITLPVAVYFFEYARASNQMDRPSPNTLQGQTHTGTESVEVRPTTQKEAP